MKDFINGLGKGTGVAVGICAAILILIIGSVVCCCAGSGSSKTTSTTKPSTSSVSKVEKEVEVIEETSTEVLQPEELVFGIGETATNGNITISLTGVEQFSQIKGEYYNDTPKDPNNVFIVMYFDATNNTNEDLTLFEYDFDVYADNYSADMNYMLFNEPKSGYSSLQKLAAGKSSRCYLAFEVPANWSKNVEAQYKKWLTANDNIIFVANKDEVTVIN